MYYNSLSSYHIRFFLHFTSTSLLFYLSSVIPLPLFYFFFFLNDPATPEIYPLPLHAAFPISISRALPVSAVTSSLSRTRQEISEHANRHSRQLNQLLPKCSEPPGGRSKEIDHARTNSSTAA